MSIEKSDLKMAVTFGIGAKLEDFLEEASAERWRNFGANSALIQASKEIEAQLCPLVKKAMEQGEINDGLSKLQVAEIVSRWVVRAANLCSHLADMAKTNELQSLGGLKYLQKTVSYVKEIHDSEKAKKESLVHQVAPILQSDIPSISEESNEPRVVGTHPGMSLSQRRRLADQMIAKEMEEVQAIQEIVEDKLEVKERKPRRVKVPSNGTSRV